jgi:hypothetical protein
MEENDINIIIKEKLTSQSATLVALAAPSIDIS